MAWLASILSVAFSAAPWLLFGLVVAGLIKAFLPEALLQRWLGGHSFASISRAAIIGVPLPMCSCGAIPTALALHRAGAGKGPTTSFLISTPSVGVDSILVTSVLMGQFMALARVVGAVSTAIATGLAVSAADKEVSVVTEIPKNSSSCCGGGCSSKKTTQQETQEVQLKVKAGLKYAFSDLLDDMSKWMFVGFLLAGILITWVTPEVLASLSDGILPLMVMALIGIPLYICAAAATPIAAGLLLSGVSPGMALVFMLAGPVTSVATLAVYRRELGNRALFTYLVSIIFVTVSLGILLNVFMQIMAIDPVIQASRIQEPMPVLVEVLSLLIFTLMAVKPLRKRLFSF